MSVSAALLALAQHDHSAAVSLLEKELSHSNSPVLTGALLTYLRSDGNGELYDDADPLTEFISGGTNEAMYQQLQRELRERYDTLAPSSLLDIGCGDGRVVDAVAGASLTRIDLVEPSEALLRQAGLRLRSATRAGVNVATHAQRADEFMRATGEQRWDIAQSTFALHTMTADERADVLAWLAGRVRHFTVAEFDVPDFADHSEAHAAYCVERYERGLLEYEGNDVVQQGFLMPVLVGQFDPSQPRHTFEQSAAAWERELAQAGFTDITVSTVFDYWWAPATLISARGQSAP